MSPTAKMNAPGRAPFHRLSDGEILLLVSRTLQPQIDDAGAPSVAARLQSLRDLLDRQQAALPELPDCAAKRRIGDALADAKSLVAQIADDLAGAAKQEAAAPQSKSA
jgi:hypothetical protein